MKRLVFLALGWLAVALGLLGVALPGLPTTPFLLLAALAFGKSSPRLKRWLETHSLFGPPIRAWEERGAIARPAKRLALSMMALIFLASLILGAPLWVLALQALGMGAGATFILTRPD